MAYEHIIYEKREGIAYLTINRPERMNALAPQTSQEIAQARLDFDSDPEMRCLIFTGAGDRAFSAGADLKAMAERIDAEGRPFAGGTRELPRWGQETWKPVIAAINGYCLGGGLETALSCDIRIAADHATFGLPEVKRGITPGPGIHLLPRAVPIGWALYMLMTGERIDAQTALQIGLVQRVVPLAQLMDTAREIAGYIAENGPLAVQAVKQVALVGRNLPVEYSVMYSWPIVERVTASEDAREGPKAFAEKRKPVYRGR